MHVKNAIKKYKNKNNKNTKKEIKTGKSFTIQNKNIKRSKSHNKITVFPRKDTGKLKTKKK